MKHIIDFDLHESAAPDDYKVEIKVQLQTNTAYKADVLVNGEVIGNIRRNTEQISMDTNKIGRQRTRVYYSVSWDQTKAKDRFGYKINNMTRIKDDCFNAAEFRQPPTVNAVKKYIKSELTRLADKNITQEFTEPS